MAAKTAKAARIREATDMRGRRLLCALGLLLAMSALAGPDSVLAVGILGEGGLLPEIGVTVTPSDDPEAVVATLQILFLVSLIALAPSLLVLLTSFTRIIIVLAFTRQALATQQMPPNQVLVGIAIFLTIFTMTPVFNEISENALTPFAEGEIGMEEAIEAGMYPIRRFMLRQLGSEQGADMLELFFNLADEQMTAPEDIPNYVLIPAFVVYEVTQGFMMGFLIYLPFIVIDMVTASILMSMGMMMLPPAMISMPFKILVFVLAGGWRMIIEQTLLTFR